MLKRLDDNEFQPINRAYNAVFRSNRLSLGLVVPLETYTQGSVPSMTRHVERVQSAEELGFSAVWLRDVPFNVPSFGDAGQVFDPFVYLGLLAGQTKRIALGVASIVLPLRHPAHVAKAAASVDVLSGGRLILGVTSGDRPEEYPAMGVAFAGRGARIRESFDYIRRLGEALPAFDNYYGSPGGGASTCCPNRRRAGFLCSSREVASKTRSGLRATAMAGCSIRETPERKSSSFAIDARELRAKAVPNGL